MSIIFVKNGVTLEEDTINKLRFRITTKRDNQLAFLKLMLIGEEDSSLRLTGTIKRLGVVDTSTAILSYRSATNVTPYIDFNKENSHTSRCRVSRNQF